MSLIQLAKEFAIKAHGDQKYGKMPYAYHLQQVVGTLIHWRDLSQWKITDEALAVAWLHDVLEDTNVTQNEIMTEFGHDVSFNVGVLTKNCFCPCHEDYIREIKLNPIAKLVKMSDTLCNLEASILSGEMRRVNKYSKQLVLLTGE